MFRFSRVLQALAVFLVGINAGVVLSLVLTPTVAALPGPVFVPMWNAMTADYSRAAPVLGILGMLAVAAAGVLAIVSARRSPSPIEGARVQAIVDGVVLLLLIATTILVTSAQMPLNEMALGWDPEALPSDWESMRSQWLAQHALRSVLTVLSFALLIVPLVWAGIPRRPRPRRATSYSDAAALSAERG